MSNEIVITLIETIDPANIGAAARAMYNFGFDKLRLVNCANHKSKRSFDLACNAKALIDSATTFDSFEEAIKDSSYVIGFTRRVGSHRIPKAWDKLAKTANKRFLKGERINLIFGREDFGLSANEAEKCHELSVIETSDKCPSINLAQSISIASYELSKYIDFEVQIPDKISANSSQTEKMLENLEKTLIKLGYDEKELRMGILGRFRGIFGRSGLEIADLGMIEGLINHIQKKVN